MASEIGFSASLSLTRTEQLANWISGALNFNQTGSRAIRTVQNVLTTAAVMQIGSIGTLGYCMIKNLDTNALNEIYLLTTTGGVKFARLGPGEVNIIKIGGDVTAPAIMALTTACQAEFMIFEL